MRISVTSRVLFDVKSDFLAVGAGGRGFVGGASTSVEDHGGVLGEKSPFFLLWVKGERFPILEPPVEESPGEAGD